MASETLSKLVKAMEGAVNLKIVTVVADVTVEKMFEDEGAVIKLENTQKSAVTWINLVDGDIKNAMHGDFMLVE
ncbi:MAG: hypothetical protein FJX56_07735 [Alphaproteobacteria bacterium]|nr:hypothetical protein [Alphaproteobacteria bacterium]